MTNFKVKDDVKFEVVQWTENGSFPGVCKFCASWLLKTSFGMLRVGLGNFVIRGPGDFKMVLDPSSFNQIFEKEE